MQSLLRWGIENSTPGAPAPAPRKDLDPAILDHILGKSDAQLMKEALEIAVDASRSEDDRVGALDNYEMLIEQIDNASNIENLNMWQPLHDLLTSPSAPDSVRRQTLWVIGTAVQNNPAAQHAYLALHPLPALLSFLAPSTPAPTRAKAVYALSSLLKHSAAAVGQLNEADGWPILRASLEESNIGVRRKTAFLLNTLLYPTDATNVAPPTPATGVNLHTSPPPSSTQGSADPVHPNTHASMVADPSSTDTSGSTLRAMHEHGLLRAVVDGLVRPVPFGPTGENERDPDFEEKLVGIIFTYATVCKGGLEAQDKADLREYFDREGEDGEKWGISAEELRALRQSLA
jgi:hypothetical protein